LSSWRPLEHVRRGNGPPVGLVHRRQENHRRRTAEGTHPRGEAAPSKSFRRWYAKGWGRKARSRARLEGKRRKRSYSPGLPLQDFCGSIAHQGRLGVKKQNQGGSKLSHRLRVKGLATCQPCEWCRLVNGIRKTGRSGERPKVSFA